MTCMVLADPEHPLLRLSRHTCRRLTEDREDPVDTCPRHITGGKDRDLRKDREDPVDREAREDTCPLHSPEDREGTDRPRRDGKQKGETFS